MIIILSDPTSLTETSSTGTLFDWSASILLAGPGFPLTAVDFCERSKNLTVQPKPRKSKVEDIKYCECLSRKEFRNSDT